MPEIADGRIVLNLFTAPAVSSVEGWKPLREGVDIFILYDAGEGGAAAALLRYAPGAEVPLHEHTGYEHIFVLRGSQSDDNGAYGPGDLVISPRGTRHRVTSIEGCMVLAIWQSPVKFL